MSDLTELLKEMDKEFGGGFDIEDGEYFVTLDRVNSKLWESEGKESAFILQWRVDGGSATGKGVGDFLRWHTSDENIARVRHGVITSMVRGVSLAVDEDRHPGIQAAYVTLLQSKDIDDSLEAIEALVDSFGYVRMPIRLLTNKSGYQNAKYLEKGGAVTMTDPREVEAVAV